MQEQIWNDAAVSAYLRYLEVQTSAQDHHSVAYAEDIADACRAIADELPVGPERDHWLGVARAYDLY